VCCYCKAILSPLNCKAKMPALAQAGVAPRLPIHHFYLPLFVISAKVYLSGSRDGNPFHSTIDPRFHGGDDEERGHLRSSLSQHKRRFTPTKACHHESGGGGISSQKRGRGSIVDFSCGPFLAKINFYREKPPFSRGQAFVGVDPRFHGGRLKLRG